MGLMIILLGACTPQSSLAESATTDSKEATAEDTASSTIETGSSSENENTEQPDIEDEEDDSGGREDFELDVCDLETNTELSYELPSSLEEAAQLTLIAGPGESYFLSKQPNDDGWFVLEVPSWMCQIQLYSEENVSITMEASEDWELNDVAFPALECNDETLFRHSWTFHAWGSYIVHIEAENMTEIWLASAMVIDF